ncbi:hypothetical protein DVH05_009775 [Phytophthora capsici]|nr:hypothetical protein DVH05_009775 [Phytophthora capsici]
METVALLKETIAAALRYEGRPALFELFLAKKGSAWLSSDTASVTDDVKELKKGKKTALIDALMQEDSELQGERLISECLKGMDDPKGAAKIHVLAVVPEFTSTVKVKEVQGEYVLADLAYYQQLGQEIQNKCQQQCGQILDKIDTIYEKRPHPTPFICVEGSSGMGKSQLAFS